MRKTADEYKNFIDTAAKAAAATASDEHKQLGTYMESGFEKLMRQLDALPSKKEVSSAFEATNQSLLKESARHMADREKVKEGIKNLSDQIADAAGRALTLIDKLFLVGIGILAAFAGWLLSQNAINNQKAPWVTLEQVTTTDYVRDTAGNIVDIVTSNSQNATVWAPATWITIIACVTFAVLISWLVLTAIPEEGGDEDEK